ncbi:MAG TPA: O-antigen ligase family protein [Roseomonas sp.]|jgi:O-antigen ligase
MSDAATGPDPASLDPGRRAGPTLPIGILLAIVPVASVLQFRALALLVTLGLVAALALHWRAERRIAWPGSLALTLVLALFGWGVVTAAWSPDPGRTISDALRNGGFVLLGAAVLRALAEQPPVALRALPRCLFYGLLAGTLLALADHLTGNAIRAGVRGLATPPPWMYFGLKPAVSVIVVLLPLAAGLVPMRPVIRAGLVLLCVVTALLLPADSAKIGAVIGLLAWGAAQFWGRWVPRLIGIGLAVFTLLAPLLIGAVLARDPSIDALPRSAAHRVLIWDFAIHRIAEKPVFGWGLEASRAVPGGTDQFPVATLDRFGLTSDAAHAWFDRPSAPQLPLHTHNAALQIWLELGLVGALLAAALLARLGFVIARLQTMAPATGAFAAAALVGMLSYGVWQEWWIGMELLLAILVASLERITSAPQAPGAAHPRGLASALPGRAGGG